MRVQTTENCVEFVFYNKPKSARGQGLNFEENCGENKLEKRAMLFRVTVLKTRQPLSITFPVKTIYIKYRIGAQL